MTQPPDWLPPHLAATYLNAIETLRQTLAPNIIDLIQNGDTAALLQHLTRTLTAGSPLTDLAAHTSSQARQHLIRKQPAEHNLSLGIRNPHAEQWQATHGATYITNIDPPTRQAILNILNRRAAEPLRPREVAQQISQLVGLTEPHQRSLQNLIDSGAPPHVIEAQRSRYLNYRADMISRTESIRQANIGQLELWAEKYRNGWITETALVQWIVTPDDRLCPLCAPMDGQTVTFTSIYESLERISTGEDLASWDRTHGATNPNEIGRFISRYKGLPDIKGRTRTATADPLSATPIRFMDIGNLRERNDPTSVISPPLHPNCRCALSIVLAEDRITERAQQDVTRNQIRENIIIRQESLAAEQARHNLNQYAATPMPPDPTGTLFQRRQVASTWLFDMLGIESSFEATDPALARRAAQRLVDLHERYGPLIGTKPLKYLGDYRGAFGSQFRPTDYRFEPRTWAHAFDEYHSIGLNPNVWRSSEEIAENLRTSHEARWHNHDTPESIIDHEVGHHIEWWLDDYGDLPLGNKVTVRSLVSRLVTKPYEMLGHGKVSGYATMSDSEAFAELFTILAHDGPGFDAEILRDPDAAPEVRNLVRRLGTILDYLAEEDFADAAQYLHRSPEALLEVLGLSDDPEAVRLLSGLASAG